MLVDIQPACRHAIRQVVFPGKAGIGAGGRKSSQRREPSQKRVSLLWLALGLVLAIGMGFVFVAMGWNWFPRVRVAEDGQALSGWIVGTVLVLIAGAALGFRQRCTPGSTAFTVYWLGSFLLIGLLSVVLSEILRFTGAGIALLIGLAVFLCGWVALAIIRRRYRAAATSRTR